MPGIGRENLRALLIGIDHYLPPPVGHRGAAYPSLGGCVHDVTRMATFLRERLGVPEGHLRTLIAPHPPGPSDTAIASYEHLVAGFHWLIEAATPGTHALVHYSGHGGRTPTHFAEQKGDYPWDEALVPTDISRPSARYLRDVELAFLLSRLADKNVFVTMVLDCCHAGGALRDEPPSRVLEPRARYNTILDWQRPAHSMVASETDLVRTWRWRSEHHSILGDEDQRAARNWLPGLDNVVVLAACAPHEKAYEFGIGPEQRGGALTHWLLDTLERHGTDLTYRQLHDHVHARVRAHLEIQTPQIEGDADRLLFQDRRRAPSRPAIMVLAVEEDRLLLNTGEAQGVRRGTRFTIHPAADSRTTTAEPCLAEVEVDETGGVESWARYLERRPQSELVPGCRAVPAEAISPSWVRTVGLEPGQTREAQAAMAMLADAMHDRAGEPLEIVSPDRPAAWRISIDPAGRWEIKDSEGKPIAHVLPALAIDQPDSARQMVDRLIQLGRFASVRALRNSGPHAPAISARLSLLSGGHRTQPERDPPRRTPIAPGTEIKVGARLGLSVANHARQPLFFSVLNLRPRWGIYQVFPAGGDWLVIEGGQQEDLVLHAGLPAGLAAATDRLKVFATLDAVRFDWLEMPDLGMLPVVGAARVQAFDSTPATGTQRRTLAHREWATTGVAIRIRR